MIRTLALAMCLSLGVCVVSGDAARGGSGWQTVPLTPLPDTRYSDLWFVDQDNGWVIDQRGRIHHTTDRGDTWTRQYDGPELGRSITFASPTRGWAGWLDGQYLRETFDGGTTWTRVTDLPPGSPPGFCGMYAADSEVVYAVGTFYGPAAMIKTTDGGDSWSAIDMSPYASTLIDCYFTSRDHGFAVGGVGTFPDSTFARVLETTDGGASWLVRHTTSQLDEWCWKISFPSALVGYVSIERGSDGTYTILKTTDGGTTWVEKAITPYRQQGIGFVTDQMGWVGGLDNTLLTTDGGDTWVDDTITPFGDRINRFRVIGPGLAFAAGEWVFRYEVTAGVDQPGLPSVVQVLPPEPNPFDSDVTLRFVLERTTDLEVSIYAPAGRLVREITSPNRGVGAHSIRWDGMDSSGRPVASGVYVCRVNTSGIPITIPVC